MTPRTEQHGGHDEQGGCGEAEGASRDGDGELARGGGSDEVIVRDRRARAALHRSNLGALQRLFPLPDARLPSPNLQRGVGNVEAIMLLAVETLEVAGSGQNLRIGPAYRPYCCCHDRSLPCLQQGLRPNAMALAGPRVAFNLE